MPHTKNTENHWFSNNLTGIITTGVMQAANFRRNFLFSKVESMVWKMRDQLNMGHSLQPGQ